MNKKLIIILTIISSIILITIIYFYNPTKILNNLYKYPISKNNIYKDFIYDIYSDHINIINYTGTKNKLTIPSHIDDKLVLTIEDSAFYGNTYIEEVIIPNTVIKIGYQSFIGCQNLKTIYIPKSVIYIGNSAFDNCPNLETIYIKKNSKQQKLLEEKNYTNYIKYK